MSLCRKALCVSICSIVGLLLSSEAGATVIADFAADYQTGSPKAGWTYEWTATGPIGNAANYGTLLADGAFYDVTPGTFPAAGPASYTTLRPSFMHPGQGSGQTSFEHYTIAAYTLGASGTVSINNLSITDGDTNGGDGVSIWIGVNNTPFVTTSFNNGGFYSNSSIALGSLNASDQIYVAIGSRGNDNNDSTVLTYQISSVPEPASCVLFGLGAIGLFIVARRRRKA